MAHVRAILWQHLWHLGQRTGVPPPDGDPNDLVPASDFVAALKHHEQDESREAGRAYVRLWARTFRTLVRHLRGQPERMIDLFVREAYPYLRGRRLAARADRLGRRAVRVVTDDDLPADYVAGLLEGFVALTGADVVVTAEGRGAFHVRFHIQTKDRAARWLGHAARLRIPLLLTSLLAATVGTALAARHGILDPVLVVALLLGTVAAQSGANAFHDLLARRPDHPLGRPGLGRGWLWFQALGSYALAGSALVLLASQRPGIALFALTGFLLGTLYARFRDQGWGPGIAVLTHGPLIVWGAAYGLAGTLPLSAPLQWGLAALPTGFLAAAVLYLDDLADRPLDEAAGNRTLVVRLPRRDQAWAFALLLGGGVLPMLALSLWLHRILLPAGILAAGLAVWLALGVARHGDDPARLAPVRIGTLALYLIAAATTAFTLLETP